MQTESLTPMQAKYRDISSTLAANEVLFLRMGDFYEVFFGSGLL